MSESERRGFWVIVSSLAVAMFLSILPMPAGLEDFNPQWVTLTIIFWSLTLPERVGVFWGFSTGLVFDVLTGALLGQQALSLALVAYVVIKLHARVQIFPLWQQSFFVWVLLLAERLLTLWVLGATGQPMPSLSYWMPTLIGLLLWPWLSAILTRIERRMGAD
jgi:rod shape-determining protein MreD